MLARFERILEQTVEGGLRRLFPTQLQPVQLAKVAARAMEEAQVVGLHGPEVPNLYRVRVSAQDMARFGDYRGTLSAELARYLAEYARDRRLRPVAQPRVELHEDPELGPGRVRVEARFVDIEPERQAALEDALEGTRRLRLGELVDAHQPHRPVQTAWLEDASGQHYPLEPDPGVARVGRSIENDIVLPGQRVSRYHAQLRFERGRWWVYDLQSTNGTYLGGRRIEGEPGAVDNGDELRFGDYPLTFRAE